MSACCPLCNQPVGGVRAGVRLALLETQVFDAIAAAGANGISAADLTRAIYGDKKHATATIRAAIDSINYRLDGTRIVAWHRKFSIVSKRNKAAA